MNLARHREYAQRNLDAAEASVAKYGYVVGMAALVGRYEAELARIRRDLRASLPHKEGEE